MRLDSSIRRTTEGMFFLAAKAVLSIVLANRITSVFQRYLMWKTSTDSGDLSQPEFNREAFGCVLETVICIAGLGEIDPSY